MAIVFTFGLIAIGNTVLYFLVREFNRNEYIQEELGGARPLNAYGLAIVCFSINLFFLLNALDWYGSWQAKIVPVSFAFITALPWIIPLIGILFEAQEYLMSVGFGTTVDVRKTPDLKTAYAFVKNEKYEEAITELELATQGYPEAFEPFFLMATVYHGMGNGAKERETLEHIMGNWRFIYDARINAANRIREIIEEESADSPELADIDAILEEFKAAKDKMRGDPNRPGHGEKIRDPHIVDLYQARRLNSRKEYKQAVPLIKGYIERHPENARAHFELVSTLERAERMDDAVMWLEKIAFKFEDRDVVWGDAMMRLAGIREHHLDDRAGAMKTLETVAERLRYQQAGKLARERLKDMHQRDQEASQQQ